LQTAVNRATGNVCANVCFHALVCFRIRSWDGTDRQTERQTGKTSCAAYQFCRTTSGTIGAFGGIAAASAVSLVADDDDNDDDEIVLS